MLLTPYTCIRQKFLYIEQPAFNAIDGIFAVTVAEQCSRHTDFRKIKRQQASRVIKCECYLSTTKCCTLVCATKDDIFHLLASHRTRCLRAQYPRNGIDNVRLARTVWTDHNGDTWLHFKDGGIGKGLEALEGERFKEHGDTNSNRQAPCSGNGTLFLTARAICRRPACCHDSDNVGFSTGHASLSISSVDTMFCLK